MNSSVVNSTLAVSAGAAVGGAKLVLVGVCLAVGFSIGNIAVRKTADAYEGWKYSRLEKKSPEPEREES